MSFRELKNELELSKKSGNKRREHTIRLLMKSKAHKLIQIKQEMDRIKQENQSCILNMPDEDIDSSSSESSDESSDEKINYDWDMILSDVVVNDPLLNNKNYYSKDDMPRDKLNNNLSNRLFNDIDIQKNRKSFYKGGTMKPYV
jgi:hypothetical protein